MTVVGCQGGVRLAWLVFAKVITLAMMKAVEGVEVILSVFACSWVESKLDRRGDNGH